MPNSSAVASPSWRIFSQSSERTFSTISSMRAGWMRPSTISFSSAWPRDLAAQRLEGRDDDRLGRVVDDEVHARGGLERPDVAAFAADDAALQVVRGKLDDGDRGLDDRVRGQPLDGHADDPAGLLGRLLVGLLLDAADEPGRLEPGLVLDGLDEVALGVDGGQPGDLLQTLPLLVDDRLDLGLLVLQPLLLVGERLSPCGRTPPRASRAGRACGRGSLPSAGPASRGRRSPGGCAWTVFSNSARAARTFSLASMSASRILASAWRRASPGPSRPRCGSRPAPLRPCVEAGRTRRQSPRRRPRRPPRRSTAIDVFIPAPQFRPGGAARTRLGYTRRRKRPFRRGLITDRTGAIPAPATTRCPSCVPGPIFGPGCRRSPTRRPGRRPVF